ncbi:MAG: hypothetical protein IKE81_09440, partial [Clostridia bacterium]|nr:hypothetical protein [Clostridia bacterium]
HGGINLSIDGEKIRDWSFLRKITMFEWLGLGGSNPKNWIDEVRNSQIRGIYANNFTQKMMEEFLDTHAEMENLHIPWNEKVTDLSKVLELPKLRYLKISNNMKKAIRSLEGKEYSFQLEIE